MSNAKIAWQRCAAVRRTMGLYVSMLRSSSSALRVSSDAAAAEEEEAAMVSVEAASVERSDATSERDLAASFAPIFARSRPSCADRRTALEAELKRLQDALREGAPAHARIIGAPARRAFERPRLGVERFDGDRISVVFLLCCLFEQYEKLQFFVTVFPSC